MLDASDEILVQSLPTVFSCSSKKLTSCLKIVLNNNFLSLKMKLSAANTEKYL